jgi:hypothetical protein
MAPATAATIQVPGDCPTLADAISAATGRDDAGGACRVSGSGVDTIELTADVTLTLDGARSVAGAGVVGLPSISSAVTINGNGHTIQRDPSLFPGPDPCGAGEASFGIFAVESAGDLTLNAVAVKNGCSTADATGSGGLSNNGGTVTVVNSTFARNAARAGSARGGGLNNNGGTVIIANSSFTENSATASRPDGDAAGGALFNGGGTMTITSSTFARNAASAGSASGGALDNGGGAVTIAGSTFAGNAAAGGWASGGALNNDGGAVTIANTLLAANTVNGAAESCGGVPGLTSSGHNLATDGSCFGADAATGDQVVADAGLDAFTDDGAPGHGHYPLLAASPAIDAGDDAACAGELAADQLGAPRVDVPGVGGPGTTCDIGAVEFQPSDATPPVLTLPASMTVEAASAAGAVVTYTATARDAMDGVVPVSCAPASGSTFPIGVTAIDCSATDAHMNVATGTFTVTVQDTAPPTVTFDAPRPAPNAHGWNNTAVSVSFTIRDAGAGVDAAASTASPLLLSAEGGAVTGTVIATDRAGNRAAAAAPAVRIDTTAPTVSIATPGAGAAFPAGQGVAADYACSDGLSGVDTCVGSVARGGNIDTAFVGLKSFAVTATDKAGNWTSQSVTYTVTVPPGAEVIHPNAPGWVLKFRTGPAECEWQFSHALASYAQCKLQCARNAPTPCGTKCDTQFQSASGRLARCPACLSAAAMDAVRRQYADAVAAWNAVIYSRRPAPGKTACEGHWSEAVGGLLWNLNTDHLQRVIGEIKTEANVSKAEARHLAAYAGRIDRLSSCAAGYAKSDALGLGAAVQAFLDASSPLPFCLLPNAGAHP